jgi:hypothetical protein
VHCINIVDHRSVLAALLQVHWLKRDEGRPLKPIKMDMPNIVKDQEKLETKAEEASRQHNVDAAALGETPGSRGQGARRGMGSCWVCTPAAECLSRGCSSFLTQCSARVESVNVECMMHCEQGSTGASAAML